jgi:spore germination cell wall hydrolase CwlJ-like protein
MRNLLLLILILIAGCNNPIVDRADFSTEDELNHYLLMRIGQGECSVCDTAEIMAVMSVAVNRVGSNRFPNTLYDVLHQRNQFHGIHRIDYDAFGEEIISPKVRYAADKVLCEGSVLDPSVLGFLRPDKISTDVGRRHYEKIKDKVVLKMKFHIFHTL